MNLFSLLWFTWKGKDGYRGVGDYLQIKIFNLLSTKKNTGKMARPQGIWYCEGLKPPFGSFLGLNWQLL